MIFNGAYVKVVTEMNFRFLLFFKKKKKKKAQVLIIFLSRVIVDLIVVQVQVHNTLYLQIRMQIYNTRLQIWNILG
jgi:hypothetical protein